MKTNFGLLICPDFQTAYDVNADDWTDQELREQLRVGNDAILRLEVDRTGDTIVVSALLNDATTREAARGDGFDLYGQRFYGPALVISGESNRRSPALDPHDVSRMIHFFRLDPSKRGDAN